MGGGGTQSKLLFRKSYYNEGNSHSESDGKCDSD